MRDKYITKEQYCRLTGWSVPEFWQKVDRGMPIRDDYMVPVRQAFKWKYKQIDQLKAEIKHERKMLEKIHRYDDLAFGMIKEHMHRVPEKVGHNLKLAVKRNEMLNEETISERVGAVSCLVFEAFDAARYDADQKAKLSEYRGRCEVAERFNGEWW